MKKMEQGALMDQNKKEEKLLGDILKYEQHK